MASKKQTTNTPDDGVVLWGRSSSDPESIEEVIVTDGGANVYQAAALAGDAQPSSESLSYKRTSEQAPYIHFNPDDALEQVVFPAPCIVYGFIGKIGTGTLTLRDDNGVNGKATHLPVYTLAVGTQVDFPAGIEFPIGLTAQCSVGTDEVTFLVKTS